MAILRRKPTKFGNEKLKFFMYQNDYTDINSGLPGPATSIRDPRLGEQALMDWNRNFANYYINNLPTRVLNIDDFADVGKLSEFMELHLFHKVTEQSKREQLVKLALNHFHQGGLPHATQNILFHRASCQIGVGKTTAKQPQYRVEFFPSENGVIINEVNTFRNIITEKPDGDMIEQTAPLNTYFAKVITRYSFTLNDQHELQVKVLGVFVDIQEPRLTKLFDKRNIFEKLLDFIKSIFKNPELNEITENPKPHR